MAEFAATGVADHSGWAILVTVAIDGDDPILLDVRRAELGEPGLPTMPYEHETRGMAADAADRLIAQVRAAAYANAHAALSRLREDLMPGHRLTAIAIRTPVLPYLPDSVADVHASWHTSCRADGVLYHNAITGAASALNLATVTMDRGSEEGAAAAAVGLESWRIPPLLRKLGREQRSWTAEHRRAAAAAICCLRDQDHDQE